MFGDHANIQLKQGVKIITSEPSTRTIEAETRNGEVISINAYYYEPAWRWPMSGERWMVTEENGSWFLTGIFEEQSGGVVAEPGDLVLSASSGRVLINVNGVLFELARSEEFPRIPKTNGAPSDLSLSGYLLPKKH